MRRRRFLILLVSLLVTLPLTARAINNAGYALIMLGDTSGLETGWTNHSTYQELSLNAKSNNMVLLDDKAPASNRKASYVAASGVSFTVSGLTAYKTYTMWIDFVTYSFSNKPGIYSRLQIFADGRQIDEIVWGEFDQQSLYAVELPLDLTYDGQVVISFKEASMQYGNWGMWDIVVASGDLPKGATLDVVSPVNVSETKLPVAEQQKTTTKETPVPVSKKVPPVEQKKTPASAQEKAQPGKKADGKKSDKSPDTQNKVNAPDQAKQADIRMPEIPLVDEPQLPGPQPPQLPTMPEVRK